MEMNLSKIKMSDAPQSASEWLMTQPHEWREIETEALFECIKRGWELHVMNIQSIARELSDTNYFAEKKFQRPYAIDSKYEQILSANEPIEGSNNLNNPKKNVTLQHGNELEQDTNGRRASNCFRMVDDSAASMEKNRNRSDIRMYEEGLGTSRDEYSECSERTRRNQESERLITIARKQGQFFSKEKVLTLGKRHGKLSGESVVFFNRPEGRVYKVKDPYAKSPMKRNVQPEDAIFEHLVHNKYFPETSYRFEGISDDIGDVRIILSQEYINSINHPTEEQIEKALADKGLLPEGNYHFGNEEITITDVTGDNVLLDLDGRIYFIDPIIDFKKPVREILDY